MNGLSLQNNEKLDHIIESCEKLQINAIFIIQSNVKWTKVIEDRIHHKFKNLHWNTDLIVVNSSYHTLTKNIWL